MPAIHIAKIILRNMVWVSVYAIGGTVPFAKNMHYKTLRLVVAHLPHF